MIDQIEYKHQGIKMLVSLHEENFKLFYKTWCNAKEKNLTLPKVNDPNYESLDALLLHIFNCARMYMNWMCKNLKIDSEISDPPAVENIYVQSETYLEELLLVWNTALSQVDRIKFNRTSYLSPWEMPYTIEGMLEHAVLHLIRHREQLLNYMNT